MAYTKDYEEWERKQIQFEGRRDEFQRRETDYLRKKSHEEYMKRHRERTMGAPPAPTLVRDKKKK